MKLFYFNSARGDAPGFIFFSVAAALLCPMKSLNSQLSSPIVIVGRSDQQSLKNVLFVLDLTARCIRSLSSPCFASFYYLVFMLETQTVGDIEPISESSAAEGERSEKCV